MKNTRITMQCEDTVWEFVCENERVATMIGAGIEKLLEDHGADKEVKVTEIETDDEVDI